MHMFVNAHCRAHAAVIPVVKPADWSYVASLATHVVTYMMLAGPVSNADMYTPLEVTCWPLLTL